MKSLVESVKIVSALPAGGAVHDNGVITGVAVERSDYESVMFVLNILDLDSGTISAVTVEESADGSTGWAALTGDRVKIIGTVAEGNVVKVGVTDIDGLSKMHMRLKFTLASVSGAAAEVATVCVLGHPRVAPAGETKSSYIS